VAPTGSATSVRAIIRLLQQPRVSAPVEPMKDCSGSNEPDGAEERELRDCDRDKPRET
jgi:hypothetical protein